MLQVAYRAKLWDESKGPLDFMAAYAQMQTVYHEEYVARWAPTWFSPVLCVLTLGICSLACSVAGGACWTVRRRRWV